jgi:hypothetical protein
MPRRKTVEEMDNSPVPQNKMMVIANGKETEVQTSGEPMMSAIAADTSSPMRRNRSASIERTDKYLNIDAGALPYKYSIGYSGAEMDARDTIILCQKAYFNIPIVRNIIDLMTEFSVGDIYLQGGNQISRNFFQAWMNKINISDYQDKHFREYYRSGNVFSFRFDGNVKPSDVKKIISFYGRQSQAYVELQVPKLQLPVRYVILNPADILFAGNISFYTGIYFKRLSDYELIRLRSPKTDEDKEVLDSLPPDIKKKIYQRNISVVNLPLNPMQVTAIFYKKQDYEPFSCPMIFPVLEDLNAKIELKHIDMAIARTMQQVVLLVTTGAEPDKGGINQANIKVLQSLFQNESVGRVLVADYTTKAQFVVPAISDILNENKYKELDRDINIGLNNILWGEEKFANQSTKIEVFLARLRHGREVFLRTFLTPEIRRISKSLGFKSYPVPYYDDVALKNNDLRDRIYLRLAEIGLLSPEEAFTALESGRLPDSQTSNENQKTYKQARDSGYYVPLIGGPKQQDGEGGAPGQKTGRPAAESRGVPQKTKKIVPMGSKGNYSVSKLIQYMKASSELNKDVVQQLKSKFNKKKLSESQLEVASDVTKVIIANEEPDNWKEKISAYCDKPIDTNPERINEIQALAAEHGLDDYSASLLYLSRIPEEE